MPIIAITVTHTAIDSRLALQGVWGWHRFQNQGVVPVYRVTATARPLSIPNDAWRYGPGQEWELPILSEDIAASTHWLMCTHDGTARVVAEEISWPR